MIFRILATLSLSLSAAFAPLQAGEALPPLVEQPMRDAPVAADRWKTDIEAYLRDLDTLKARFIQIGANGSRAEGQVLLSRPGRARFDYGESSPILVVADGRFIHFIDYSNRQVTRSPISATPLRILLDQDFKFGKDTEVVEWAQGQLANMASVTLRDPKYRKQGTLTLHFIRQGGGKIALLGWELLDSQKKLTQMVLADVATNTALPDSAWTFKDPRQKPARN